MYLTCTIIVLLKIYGITAGNRHKQNSWFCKEIREDNFRFWWRRNHEDASQGGSQVKYATTSDVNVLEYGDALFMEVLEPEDVSYLYKLRPAKNFGGDFNKQHFGIALVPGDPYHGCSRLNNNNDILHAVALIQRGGCSFVTKAFNAEQAGAVAIIITDQDEENDMGNVDMIQDGTERDVSIPALYLLGKDGYMIKKTIERYHLASAVINIPINITSVPIHQRHNRPPWVLW